MRRTIFILVIILCFLIIGSLSFVYLKLHHQPDWYSQYNQDSVNVLLKQSRKIRRSLLINLKKKETVEVSGRDLSSLILSEIKLRSPLKTDKTVKAINTSISDKNIIIEMVIDLNQLHRDDFSGRTFRYIEWAKKWVPENIKREFYAQLVIYPVKKGNMIDFSERSVIRIAGVDFPVKEVLNQIGFEKYFIQTDYHLQDFVLTKDKLVLRD